MAKSKFKSPANKTCGKGCLQRPMSVDQKTFDKNWEQIFGKPKVNVKIDNGKG
jgi:hypothetical protein